MTDACYDGRVMAVIDDVSFESTRTMSQARFAEWVREHERWDPHRYELIMGRIVMNPPAGYPHGEVESRVQLAVAQHVRAQRLGRVFGSSQGFELPTGDTLEPDLSFVSNERWSAGPRPEIGKFLRVVPDLVVEILSTSTASRDRGEKKGVYERCGVREYWLVDWRAREIVVFTLEGDRFGPERVFSERDRLESVVLAGIDLAVVESFPTEE